MGIHLPQGCTEANPGPGQGIGAGLHRCVYYAASLRVRGEFFSVVLVLSWQLTVVGHRLLLLDIASFANCLRRRNGKGLNMRMSSIVVNSSSILIIYPSRPQTGSVLLVSDMFDPKLTRQVDAQTRDPHALGTRLRMAHQLLVSKGLVGFKSLLRDSPRLASKCTTHRRTGPSMTTTLHSHSDTVYTWMPHTRSCS